MRSFDFLAALPYPISVPLRWVIAKKIGHIGVLPLLSLEFAAVIAFAHFSFVWFETPILSMKRFVQYRTVGAAQPSRV